MYIAWDGKAFVENRQGAEGWWNPLLPNAMAYLEQYRAVLERRAYIAAAKREWFELWVPHNPDSWAAPKLVFIDISEKPCFWLNLDGAVVNGDCYWLTPNNGMMDKLWLALAVANSTFVEEFYDRSFNNKLYAGRRRFMAQYVEQFPLPGPESVLSRQIVARTKKAFDSIGDELNDHKAALNGMVWASFGFNAPVS